jgi:diaminohydroxyphosphoribosylaminopyrimidine deaminase / 5-amino-6-(5-phosphoribosylamino)uracil reductase
MATRGRCVFASLFLLTYGGERLDFMARALELAERAKGWCSPNPAVGAVLVRDDEIVGEGFTQPPGQAHAEVMALRAAGDRARGAALYVTLEPCSHYGRTPPCTEAVLRAGVAEVHAAMVDPSTWVNGKGMHALEAAGLKASVGQRAQDAWRLNQAYFKWVATHLPFVTLKYAMTADGKIATRTGSSSYISGVESRRQVARLRSQVDAVLVGIGTVLADDPQLTARPQEFGDPDEGPVHQPLRVVLDSIGRLPVTAKVASGGLPGRTLCCTTARISSARRAALEKLGVEVAVVPDLDGRVDVCGALSLLGERQVTSILAESGGSLTASLLEAQAVDQVLAFVAPRIAGGANAPTPVEGEGVALMVDALELVDPTWTVLGRDVLLSGYTPWAFGAEQDPAAQTTSGAA